MFGVRWKGRRFLPPFHRYLDFSGKTVVAIGGARPLSILPKSGAPLILLASSLMPEVSGTPSLRFN